MDSGEASEIFHIPCPRVINVDDNPSYPKVVAELKREQKLRRRSRWRACLDLNNIVEQDHPSDQKLRQYEPRFRSFDAARRAIQGAALEFARGTFATCSEEHNWYEHFQLLMRHPVINAGVQIAAWHHYRLPEDLLST